MSYSLFTESARVANLLTLTIRSHGLVLVKGWETHANLIWNLSCKTDELLISHCYSSYSVFNCTQYESIRNSACYFKQLYSWAWFLQTRIGQMRGVFIKKIFVTKGITVINGAPAYTATKVIQGHGQHWTKHMVDVCICRWNLLPDINNNRILTKFYI
jgi:hypothetical protein